ncbi:hypothetical protein E4T47_07189 [Aureobasidium subglaciale]|nr:hypothetical protein E4T47_07189 [Aureobasidium subglaciale]
MPHFACNTLPSCPIPPAPFLLYNEKHELLDFSFCSRLGGSLFMALVFACSFSFLLPCYATKRSILYKKRPQDTFDAHAHHIAREPKSHEYTTFTFTAAVDTNICSASSGVGNMSIARKLVNAVVSIGGFAVGVGVYHRFSDAVPTQTASQGPSTTITTPEHTGVAGVSGVDGKQTS